MFYDQKLANFDISFESLFQNLISANNYSLHFLTASVNRGPCNTYACVVVVLRTLIQNRSRTPTLAVKMRNTFSH